MEIDYSPFLHVLPDRNIWWCLTDAIKLGAGYLPICDTAHDLKPVLRAENNQVLANEITLLSEISQSDPKVAYPDFLVRDNCHYVEAHEFLDWLCRYVVKQTEPKIAYPYDLNNAVRKATSATKAPSSDTPPFESLTIVLQEWFDQPLAKLPESLGQLVKQEFSPMQWDGLTGEQRRNLALQRDYQHDPATAQERQFRWDFFERVDGLKKQIAEWEVVATPTAADLELKKTRLAELKQELSLMDAQKRLARGDYFPERRPSQNKKGTPLAEPALAAQYMAYPKAMHQLTARLGANSEELAAWIWNGPEDGGIAAYLNANELDPPPRFSYTTGSDSQDYIAPLMACWFKADDIDQFMPADRYIVGVVLIERWSKRPGLHAVAFIQAKIAESRLLDINPIYGGTRGTFSEHADWPPLESGLFSLAHVVQIETEDFVEVAPLDKPDDPAQSTKQQTGGEHLQVLTDTTAADKARGSTVRRDARKLNTQAMYKQWQKAYRTAAKEHPNMRDTWYAKHIAKKDIGKKRSADTIRKHMKP